MNKSTYRNFFIWLLLVISILLTFLLTLPHSKFNSNLFEMLPENTTQQYDPEILNDFVENLDEQVIWLVQLPHKDDYEIADTFVSFLKKTNQFKDIFYQKNNEDLSKYQQDFFKYRYSLIDNSIKEQILSPNFQQWLLSQIYSPFSGVSANEIKKDPLLLTRIKAFAELEKHSHYAIKKGRIVLTDNDNEWVLIRASLEQSNLNIVNIKKFVHSLDHFENHLKNTYNIEILKKGSIFYTDYAAKTAESDITIIGGLSILAIIFCFVFIFRSATPIVLTFSALIFGVLTGITSVFLIYKEIHLITLVMSTTIIGVSIDYTLLYLINRLVRDKRITNSNIIKQILPSLIFALISTITAYIALLTTSFPILNQLAVFTISGLIAVFATVYLLFPCTTFKTTNRYSPLIDQLKKSLSFYKNRNIYIPAIIGLLCFNIIGLSQLKSNDDIGKMQDLPTHLVAEGKKIDSIMKESSSQQILMISDQSIENLFQKIERLYPVLNELNINYKQFPFYSEKKQIENFTVLFNRTVQIESLYKKQNIDITNSLPELRLLKFDQWLKSPLSEGWNNFFTDKNGLYTIAIPVDATINQINTVVFEHGVYFIDRKAEITDVFKSYKINLEKILIIALCLLVILFALISGLKKFLFLSLPIVFAVTTPLSILGYAGIPYDFFVIVGLILIAGMAIDYVFFFKGYQDTNSISFFVIFIAAIISELTFGSLIFSSTNVIQKLGIVLSLGIITALILSPFASNIEK